MPGIKTLGKLFFQKKMRPVKTHAYPRGPLVNRAGLIGC
jgi:hypothetical protein